MTNSRRKENYMKIMKHITVICLILSIFLGTLESEAAFGSVGYVNEGPGVYTESTDREPTVTEMINWLSNNVYNRTEGEKALVREYMMISCGNNTGRQIVRATDGNMYYQIPSDVQGNRGMADAKLLSGAVLYASTNSGFLLSVDALNHIDVSVSELKDGFTLAKETKEATAGMTDLEKISYAYNYVRRDFKWDLSSDRLNRCAFPAIKRKTGCCETINGMFYLMMRASGVDADFCSGGNHRWCTVMLDGVRYHVDATTVVPYLVTDESVPEAYKPFRY